MTNEDNGGATRQRKREMPHEEQQKTGGRTDDRGQELPDSPVPDPEETEQPNPQDDPQAD
jgi:deferrochelatase/peroxidase EfeB